jgi:hypothetical protein
MIRNGIRQALEIQARIFLLAAFFPILNLIARSQSPTNDRLFVCRWTRLVEETEAHVLIGLLLLLLLLSSGSLGSGSTTGSGSRGSSATSTAGGNGSKLGGTLSDQLFRRLSLARRPRLATIYTITNLVDVLALELSNELLEALVVGVNTDGRENLLDVGGGGRLVASKGEEEVGCEVLHFEL